jgi:hypothetical protein
MPTESQRDMHNPIVPRGRLADREIPPADYGLLSPGEVAVPLENPDPDRMEISAAIWGCAVDAARGIAERAWHANRQGRASRTYAARRGTPPR